MWYSLPRSGFQCWAIYPQKHHLYDNWQMAPNDIACPIRDKCSSCLGIGCARNMPSYWLFLLIHSTWSHIVCVECYVIITPKKPRRAATARVDFISRIFAGSWMCWSELGIRKGVEESSGWRGGGISGGVSCVTGCIQRCLGWSYLVHATAGHTVSAQSSVPNTDLDSMSLWCSVPVYLIFL